MDLSLFQKEKQLNNKPITVVDIGCGPFKLFKVLNENSLALNYIGIEPRENFVEAATERYNSMNNFQIIKGYAQEIIPNINQKIDIFTGLDCFEHIPEYIVPTLLRSISAKSPKIFACSVHNNNSLFTQYLD